MFNLHGQQEGSGGHAHNEHEGEEEENREYIWRGCVILLGVYVFFLLELFLHSWADLLKTVRTYTHTHTHTHTHTYTHTQHTHSHTSEHIIEVGHLP